MAVVVGVGCAGRDPYIQPTRVSVPYTAQCTMYERTYTAHTTQNIRVGTHTQVWWECRDVWK